MSEAPWEVRAEAAGSIVDIQAKALKAALTESKPDVRAAYIRMAEAAEMAFALVVPEVIQSAMSKEHLLPDPSAQVGGVEPYSTDDPLVVLLYLLLRDHLHAGIFERLISELGDGGSSLTNPYLGQYAVNIAQRLREDRGTPIPSLSEDEATAISDCVAVAARIGAAFEFYGGIEVHKAARKATDALDRLGIQHETEVED